MNFALPDLSGRAAVGVGHGFGLQPYDLGQRSGAETTTIDVNHMPTHTHTVSIETLAIAAASTPGNKQSPANAVPAAEAVGVTATYSTAVPDIKMASSALTGLPAITAREAGSR